MSHTTIFNPSVFSFLSSDHPLTIRNKVRIDMTTTTTSATAPSTPVSAKAPASVFSCSSATSTRTLPCTPPAFRFGGLHAPIDTIYDPDNTGDCLLRAPVGLYQTQRLLRVHKARLGKLPMMQMRDKEDAKDIEVFEGLVVYKVDEPLPVWRAMLRSQYPRAGSADLMMLDFDVLVAVWEAATKYDMEGVMCFAEACIRYVAQRLRRTFAGPMLTRPLNTGSTSASPRTPLHYISMCCPSLQAERD